MPTWPPAIASDGRVAEQLGDLVPVARDRLAGLGRGGRLQLAVQLVDGPQVPVVDVAHTPDGVREGRLGDGRARGPAGHGVHTVQGSLEPQRVEAGQLVHRVAVRQRLGREVLVAGQHVAEPAVEVQVAGAALHHLVELAVGGLAVLPAGGHRRHRALGRDRADDGARGREEALRAEEDGPAPVSRRGPGRCVRRRRASSGRCRSRGGAAAPTRSPCSPPRPAGSPYRCRAGARR